MIKSISTFNRKVSKSVHINIDKVAQDVKNKSERRRYYRPVCVCVCARAYSIVVVCYCYKKMKNIKNYYDFYFWNKPSA